MKFIWNILIFLVFAIVAMIFGLQNPELVSVNFFGSKFDISLGLVIISAFLLSAILVFILMMYQVFARSFIIIQLKLKIKKLEERIKNEAISYESEGLGTEGEFRRDLEPVKEEYDIDLNK